MPQSLPHYEDASNPLLEQHLNNEQLFLDKEQKIDEEEEVKEETTTTLLSVRQQSFDKQRRSLSMLKPSQKEQLSKLMVEGYDKNEQITTQKKQNNLIEELDGLKDEGDHAPDKRRMTVNDKDFYDNRPNNTIFIETSNEQDERVRKNSPFGGLKTWKLIKLIVKSNDDVRQEQFAMQLISQMDQIFKIKKLNLWLRTYEILATGPRCGLIEAVSDALSIDSIKKKIGDNSKLIDYYYMQFGDRKSKSKLYTITLNPFFYHFQSSERQETTSASLQLPTVWFATSCKSRTVTTVTSWWTSWAMSCTSISASCSPMHQARA